MEEFLTKLYSYENFSTYLIAAIVILIILFFVILFVGKKDKKEREIEATKKLIKINEDNLNTEAGVVGTVESKPEKEVLENDTIMVPSINEISNPEPVSDPIPEPTLPVEVPEEPIKEITPVEEDLPVIPEVPFEDSALPDVIDKEYELVDNTPPVNDAFKEEETVSPIEVPINDFEPVLFKDEEKPLVVDEEKPQEMHSEVNVPDFNYDDIIKNVEDVIRDEHHEINKGPEVFSSVYVPEEKKEVPKKEINDEEIELPTLKKDVKEKGIDDRIEIPEINNFNFDDISGETYDIK